MMQINGKMIHLDVDTDTVTVDDDDHHLPPGETLELDGLIIARDSNGNISASSTGIRAGGSGVENISTGPVAGNVVQAGTMNIIRR